MEFVLIFTTGASSLDPTKDFRPPNPLGYSLQINCCVGHRLKSVVERRLLLVIPLDTSERRHTTFTVSPLGRFGWTVFNVAVLRLILMNVHITTGVYTAVNITKTSLFHVPQVTVYYSCLLAITCSLHKITL